MIDLLVQLKPIELEGLWTYMGDFTCFNLPISIFTKTHLLGIDEEIIFHLLHLTSNFLP